MKRDVVVGVDCDGVIVDFASTYLEILNETFGLDKTLQDITNHDFHKCVATPSQNAVVWGIIQRSPGLVYNLPAIEGAHTALQHLRSWAKRVVCVTSPAERHGDTHGAWASERLRCLMHRFGFEKRDVFIVSDKSLVAIDALIDDLPRNLDDHPTIDFAYLVAQPWNANVPPSNLRSRVASLFDASVELELESR